MSTAATAAQAGLLFSCQRVPPARPVPDLAADLRAGFAQRPRRLPPKYFYDERGSRLFEAICATPEYYPTRTEAALLSAHAPAIVAAARPQHVLELGAGSARKTQRLLAACAAAGSAPQYWPFDVCEEMLRTAAAELAARFPWLRVRALVGDYLAGLAHLPRPPGRRLYVFLGGTIGNFMPAQAVRFLSELSAGMGPQDRLLLGADRLKAPARLEAAYDDAAGITAAFNLNLLNVLNRDLGADFDPAGFAHRASFVASASRIEMHLVARRAQTVRVAALGRRYRFAAGEHLLTEISRKFSRRSLARLLARAGLAAEAHFEAEGSDYSLVLARRQESRVTTL